MFQSLVIFERTHILGIYAKISDSKNNESLKKKNTLVS